MPRAIPRDVVPVRYGALLAAALQRGGGDPVLALRHALRERLGVRAVALVSSARAGLAWLLGRVARRRGEGEVLLFNYNFFAVREAVVRAGLTPVPLEADDDFGEPSPERLEAAIGPRTAALLVSHHFGRPSRADRWAEIARARGLALLEDCAHAWGAAVGGRSVGAWGDGGVFSLTLTKGLVGVAGGVLVTADADVAREAEAWEASLPPPAGVARGLVSAAAGKALLDPRWYPALHAVNRLLLRAGADPLDRMMTEAPGKPWAPPRRLPRPYARVALAHLPAADAEVELRRRLYRRVVDGGPFPGLTLGAWDDDRRSSCLALVARTKARRALRLHLVRRGFDTRPDYLTALDSDRGRFPRSAALPETGLYLPLRSLRDEAEAERLAEALRAFRG